MPYPYPTSIPPLVERAHAHARSLGFPLMPEGRPIGEPSPTTAVTPMDGALLRALAAAHPGGRIGEAGTGPGVSTAWLLSGAASDTRIITCETDASLAAGVASFFRDQANLEVLCGPWQDALAGRGPFDLLFFDADVYPRLADRATWDLVVDLLAPGGQIVLDDLFPVELWPDSWRGKTDLKREFCLNNPRLAGVEVRTSARTAALIGTRIS